jgi:phosphatidylglycerophosphate synthase
MVPAPSPSTDPASPAAARRPIASRGSGWAIRASAALARSSVTPNQISAASVAFAAAGAGLILAAPNPVALVLAAGMVQLRLVANLLDGMVAVEGGKSSAVGALYNEFPDRIADTLFLVPAGYAAGLPWLGWAAALAAALTAYVRVFGGALGLKQSFAGIMAKQRRMAALTIALVAQAAEAVVHPGSTLSLTAGLAVILAGSLWTCVTRTRAIAAGLKSR